MGSFWGFLTLLNRIDSDFESTKHLFLVLVPHIRRRGRILPKIGGVFVSGVRKESVAPENSAEPRATLSATVKVQEAVFIATRYYLALLMRM